MSSAPITRFPHSPENLTALPTGAVSGYCNMLWKLLEDMKGPDEPTHVAVIFDAGAVTFRNKIYPQYKANRPEPPEESDPAIPAGARCDARVQRRLCRACEL
ncbi:MAG: hypothetical protein WDM89_12275 [Rhizomicrobium sp.]